MILASPRLLAAAGVLFCLSAWGARAEAQNYDFTRSWTQCTAGSSNACAQLIVRTASLNGGGSVVDIGVSNLQGRSPFDNLTGSLLHSVSFTLAPGAGADAYSGAVDGTAGGGATVGSAWSYTADQSSIVLNAATNPWSTTTPEELQNWAYTCTYVRNGHCTSFSTNHYTTLGTSVHKHDERTGIAGVSSQSYTETIASGSHAEPVRRDTYSTYTGYDTYTYSYSCGSWWSSRTCYGTGYSYFNAYNLQENHTTAQVTDYTTTQLDASGQTAGEGDVVWFSFQSANQYDVRQFEEAEFGTYDLQSGADLRCDGQNAASCLVFEDVLTNNLATSTVTPEPVSMLLLGSGLAGVAAARRRRKSPSA